jgi:hypothetical protein
MIKLELTIEQVQLILGALSNLPFHQVANVIQFVKTEAEAQLKANAEAKTEVAN